MEENEAAAPAEAVALDMLAAVATPEGGPFEIPEAFLIDVSVALKAAEEVDSDLAAILSDHLLTVTPNANVIANATAAIQALAAKRAAPAEEQTDG